MTKDKFSDDFNDKQWEDANYVKRISEYAKQDLMYLVNKKPKSINIIKNSFIGDKKHNEEPMIYKTIKSRGFTDVLTPVSKTPGQTYLWKDFISSHYHDVDYNGQHMRNNYNEEYHYDAKGNPTAYEKVIMGHQTPI